MGTSRAAFLYYLPAKPRERNNDHAPEALLASHSSTDRRRVDRKSTRLNSSHPSISYAVFCLKKKKNNKSNNCLLTKIKGYVITQNQLSTNTNVDICTSTI